uniref:Phospholipid-transporting ATPase n=1 Tax=Parastrongyloides trichosuri TaxID=131310 RepID=A0A0N5A612_PARTI
MSSDRVNRHKPTSRNIIINSIHQNEKFCSNKISTCKYSVFTFFPRFLLEQFRRYNNIFFLVIALLQQIPDVSPTGRYTTAGPFLLILFISALKEIFEDVKRRRLDIKVNNFTTMVLRNGRWEEIPWKDITVGEILKIENNHLIPADLVILSSSESNSMAYIETSNLDGETNLKIRQALVETSELTSIEKISEFRGEIECELPSKHVNSFTGTMHFHYNNLSRPLSVNQLLLRGAALKNTKWVIGVTVYTGHDAKLLMNSRTAPLKRSYIDSMTNNRIIVLFFILIFLALASTFGAWVYGKDLEHAWYLGAMRGSDPFWDFITFFILYNNLIPISLQVTLEIVRFFQAAYINNDEDMYHEESDTTAIARTSNLNEELGQVKYIMSDKTGTLTRNVMKFKKLYVGKRSYGDDVSEEFNDYSVVDDVRNKVEDADMIKEAFMIMASCHTVVPEFVDMDEDNITYQAASPDELALVKGAAKMNFIFKKRFASSIEIEVLGKREMIEILNVLEFNSNRKRMGVIIKDSKGTIKLYVKGADAVIIPRLSKNTTSEESANLDFHLSDYAGKGYRTLCFAKRELDSDFYDTWKHKFLEASISIVDREKKLDQVAEEVETNLTLVGASAIEDKLQEGVPDTIASLLEAKIKVWILTGDKRETAINIAQSSALFSPNSNILFLSGKMYEETVLCLNDIRNAADRYSKNGDKFALVVDGACLHNIITGECRSDFLDLAIECETVVCCRMSPMQKSDVVELIQTRCNHVLAVGDGANDVAMIQSANVGVGISGAEGLQAASASDYSIGQFRFLKKLILVHGAWNYNRSVKVILYSFYKNICLYLIELWFALYSAFSGQTLFERWTIALFNVLFTFWPPVILGLFDRPVSEKQLINNPYLYKSLQKISFSNVQFYTWITMSIAHSIILYWMSYGFLYNPIVWDNGRSGGWLMLGNSCYTFVVATVCLKALIECDSWTWVIVAFSLGSIGVWFIFFLIYSSIWPYIPLGADMSGHFWFMISSPSFWCAFILIPITTLIPDIGLKCIKFITSPTMCDYAKIQDKTGNRLIIHPSEQQFDQSSSVSYRQQTEFINFNTVQRNHPPSNDEKTSLKPTQNQSPSYGTNATSSVHSPDGAYVNFACEDNDTNNYARFI